MNDLDYQDNHERQIVNLTGAPQILVCEGEEMELPPHSSLPVPTLESMDLEAGGTIAFPWGCEDSEGEKREVMIAHPPEMINLPPEEDENTRAGLEDNQVSRVIYVVSERFVGYSDRSDLFYLSDWRWDPERNRNLAHTITPIRL